jgi:hypothetical protein
MGNPFWAKMLILLSFIKAADSNHCHGKPEENGELWFINQINCHGTTKKSVWKKQPENMFMAS